MNRKPPTFGRATADNSPYLFEFASVYDCEQNTPEWFELRKSIPTASSASKILTGKGVRSESLDGYAQTLADELVNGINPNKFHGNVHTDFGHTYEPFALEWYQERLGSPVYQTGFAVRFGMGGSLDATSLEGARNVEVKCFPKRHDKAVKHFLKTGTCELARKPQIQWNMAITGASYTDLVHYLPDDRSTNICITIPRDETYIAKQMHYADECRQLRNQYVKQLRKLKSYGG